jgi:hypothetical protein
MSSFCSTFNSPMYHNVHTLAPATAVLTTNSEPSFLYCLYSEYYSSCFHHVFNPEINCRRRYIPEISHAPQTSAQGKGSEKLEMNICTYLSILLLLQTVVQKSMHFRTLFFWKSSNSPAWSLGQLLQLGSFHSPSVTDDWRSEEATAPVMMRKMTGQSRQGRPKRTWFASASMH